LSFVFQKHTLKSGLEIFNKFIKIGEVMVTRKSISKMFSVLLVVIFMLTGVLPVQAASPASSLYAGGSFLWAKGMGGTSGDSGNSIALDSSSNVYTTGEFAGTADFDPSVGVANLISAGSGDIFVSKLGSSGNFVWAKSMGGTAYDEAYGIAVDSNGNVYTTGQFNGTVDFDPGVGTSNLTSVGQSDIFVSKLDTNGDFVWAKSMGGWSWDYGYSIAVDSNGNVYTTGYFQQDVDFDPGTDTYILSETGMPDIFVSKLDSSGNFVWAKSMGGPSSLDYGNVITIDASGNVYTTGIFQGTVDFDPGVSVANLASAGDRDIFVSKLDSSGNYVWAKSMGGTASDSGINIAIDSGGNVYTTGRFQGTADFDPGAGLSNLTSTGGSDIFVSKLDSSGNFIWAKGMGGTAYDSGYSIVVDSGGNVYTTGEYDGTADFDPGTGIATLACSGLSDIFISKLDSSGNFVWIRRMGGSGSDWANDIALDSSDNMYTTGYFEGTADFNPSAGMTNLTSAGLGDIFVSKTPSVYYELFLPLILR
jgi:hypothetical protein